jgi:methylamine dehydrogenase light chain
MGLDDLVEREARRLALSVSRRSILARIARLAVSAAFIFPALPFDRSARAADDERDGPKEADDKTCEYWRYCAIDGFLCTCCGGTVSSCPPGTEVSAVTWIGTCRNRDDGREYLISYNDCCGRTVCGRCACNTNNGELPGYRMGKHNDVDWCMANKSAQYHCTVAAIVGVLEQRN